MQRAIELRRISHIKLLVNADPSLAYAVDATSGVLTLSGPGELRLQTACDRALLDSGAACRVGPLLSPSASSNTAVSGT